MTRNDRSLQRVIAGVFFMICFAFFQFIYPNHLFLKEQMRIFMFTTDYFISFWDEPAGLTCYIGNFLTQFFVLPVVGPLIVTGLLLLQWFLSMRILRKFGCGNMVGIYALLPVALEWWLMSRLTYNVSATLSLIFVMWIFLLYIRIRDKRLSFWVAFLCLPLIYSLAGSRLFLFSLMVIFYQGAKNKKNWLFWVLLLFSSYMFPLFMGRLYGLSIEEAYKYTYVDGFSVYFPALFLILEIFALQMQRVRRIRLERKNMLITGVAIFLVFGFVILSTNRKREKILAIDSAAYHGDWEEVLRLSASVSSQEVLAAYYRNIALAKKNALPDSLMSCSVHEANALFLPVDLRSSMLPVFFSNEVYYQLGDMEMARHRTLQGILYAPKQRSVRLIKRLVEIDLREGNVEDARKNLRLLESTLFYRGWAEAKKAQWKIKDEMPVENRLPRKEDWERTNDRMIPLSDYPEVLCRLIRQHPENRQALDYLLCYYLLNENLNAFKNAFDTYYKEKETDVPRLYKEALVKALSDEGKEEIDEYQIPHEVVDDYKRYLLGKTGRQAKEELRNRYSSTYWYYWDYVKCN